MPPPPPREEVDDMLESCRNMKGLFIILLCAFRVLAFVLPLSVFSSWSNDIEAAEVDDMDEVVRPKEAAWLEWCMSL